MKKKDVNILFLDIDGCMNSYQSWFALGNSYKGHTNFDPIAVRLLFLACKDCDLKLVIHSSWSSDCDTQYYKEAFKEYETEKIKMPEILDYQTRSVYWEQNRVQRIQNNYHHYKPKKWVAVDDEDLEYYIGKTKMKDGLVIKTDPAVGFNYYNYARILGYFDKNLPIVML